ncbi:MAG: hypothetical protein JWR72_1971 [Flavisolibacter sp.]|jgi:hypothetical protein|nr:hypothetical protein [Flavisolibacter sp.]
MKIFSLLTCLLIGIGFWSCSKDSDPAPVQPTKTDNISSSAWKYESGGVDQDKNGTIDIAGTTLFGPCSLDNTITFKKDNTGITDEGSIKCNGTDPQSAPFNWSFADAEANITISNNIFSLLNGKFKVVSLTSSAFTLSKDSTIGPLSVSLIVNLKH